MVRKRVLIDDPLDVVRANEPAKPGVQPRCSKPSAVSYTKYPLRITTALASKARDVAYWDRIGVSELAEIALRREIERRESKRGKPYPPREREHKPGRKSGR